MDVAKPVSEMTDTEILAYIRTLHAQREARAAEASQARERKVTEVKEKKEKTETAAKAFKDITRSLFADE